LINPGKNDRVNVKKIINGTCVVLSDNIQHFSDKTNPLETLQLHRGKKKANAV